MELLIAIGFGLASGYIAGNKNRNTVLWFFIGAFTTFVGLAIILFLPAANTKTSRQSSVNLNPGEKLVYCPSCGSDIVIDSPGYWTCPHCNHTFEYGEQTADKGNEGELPIISERLVQLLAKVAKADGVVTKVEIRKVDELLKQVIQPSDEQLRQIRKVFNEAKHTSIGYEGIAKELHRYLNQNATFLRDIIILLFEVASADGQVHPEQERLISHVASLFNLTHEYNQISSQYVDNLDEYYKILGCSSTDSIDTIKRKYRELVKQYHPDKFASKDLPSEMIELANKKFNEIKQAYDKILEAKSA